MLCAKIRRHVSIGAQRAFPWKMNDFYKRHSVCHPSAFSSFHIFNCAKIRVHVWIGAQRAFLLNLKATQEFPNLSMKETV